MRLIKFITNIVGILFIACCSSSDIKNARIEASAVPHIYTRFSSADFKEDNGVLFHKNALYNGYVITYFENGDTNSITGYLNGLKENTSRSYYSNKQMQEVRIYHANKKIGEHVCWYENGNLRFKYHFGNDVYEGTVEDWYADGKRASVFNFKNGYESGLQQAWYGDGKFRLNYEVVNDRKYGLTGVNNCESVLDTTLNKLIAKKTAQ